MGNTCCYIPPDEIVDRCLVYAEAKNPHNEYYVRKRNADPKKTKNQDAYSKLAEFGAAEFLRELGCKFDVDTNIYKPSQKNWEADLGKRIMVKSTSLEMSGYISRNTDGDSFESWTFQYRDNDGVGGIDTGVFALTNEQRAQKYCVFATVEDEKIDYGTKVWIRGMWKLNRLFDKRMFKDPISNKFGGIKKNIYDGDMKKAASSESIDDKNGKIII